MARLFGKEIEFSRASAAGAPGTGAQQRLLQPILVRLRTSSHYLLGRSAIGWQRVCQSLRSCIQLLQHVFTIITCQFSSRQMQAGLLAGIAQAGFAHRPSSMTDASTLSQKHICPACNSIPSQSYRLACSPGSRNPNAPKPALCKHRHPPATHLLLLLPATAKGDAKKASQN